jgi:hypothetical protein
MPNLIQFARPRKRSFATIDNMLSNNFAPFVRDDRSRPLVVMTIQSFAAFAAGTETAGVRAVNPPQELKQ